MERLPDISQYLNGVYPVIPGFITSLGCYGYWENNVWREMGNLKKDFGPIFFTEEKRELNTNIQVTVGTDIQFQADTAATATTEGVAANIHL